MAAATRQDDQGNVVQVGEEGDEGDEGEYQDTEGQGPGDDRGWGAPNPWDPPYGGACGCHPLDPLPPDPMDLQGNLVDVLKDASLQANPGHRWRYQQALHRHAHGGWYHARPWLKPRLRWWWYTQSEDSSSHL